MYRPKGLFFCTFLGKKGIIMAIKNKCELHITKKHTGKMEGMQSLSTSCRGNKYCMERAKNPDSICSLCFADRMMDMYKNLDPCMQRNGDILSSKILSEDELPRINAAYFRFESFGDLINEYHAINYFRICKKNPATHFALWTKNPFLIQKAIDDYKVEKPKNLIIVLSSPFLNKKVDASRWTFIDKTFTVYDNETIKIKDLKINCGGRSCMSCLRCYKKNTSKDIREEVK